MPYRKVENKQALLAAARAMRQSQRPLPEIAAEIGVSTSTLQTWLGQRPAPAAAARTLRRSLADAQATSVAPLAIGNTGARNARFTHLYIDGRRACRPSDPAITVHPDRADCWPTCRSCRATLTEMFTAFDHRSHARPVAGCPPCGRQVEEERQAQARAVRQQAAQAVVEGICNFCGAPARDFACQRHASVPHERAEVRIHLDPRLQWARVVLARTQHPCRGNLAHGQQPARFAQAAACPGVILEDEPYLRIGGDFGSRHCQDCAAAFFALLLVSEADFERLNRELDRQAWDAIYGRPDEALRV